MFDRQSKGDSHRRSLHRRRLSDRDPVMRNTKTEDVEGNCCPDPGP